MGCASSKSSKAEGDTDLYHHEILIAAQTDDLKRLREILDELDRRKASNMKKEVLNRGMSNRFNLFFMGPKRSLMRTCSVPECPDDHSVRFDY